MYNVPDSVDGRGCRLLADAAAAAAGTLAAVAAGSSFGGGGFLLAEDGCKMQSQWPMVVC